MPAEIIDLAGRRPAENSGNGAREALIELALTLPNETERNDAAAWSDWILAELWMRGFKVVPVE